MQKAKKKKIRLSVIVGLVSLLIGVGFLCYPTLNNFFFERGQEKVIEDYVEEIEIIKSTNNGTIKTFSDNTDYERLRKDVKAYNKKIYEEHQIGLSIEHSYQAPALSLSSYGLKNNVYGYIEIPSIDVKMSILLGANDSNMAQGAAHMSHTSIPFGGKNTNSVIAGHCGYSGRHMFRYINNLQKGAVVKITTPFDTLIYKVTEIKIIDPNDAQSLVIQDDKDMLTLLTCYPYPTNTYRCAVYCERSEQDK